MSRHKKYKKKSKFVLFRRGQHQVIRTVANKSIYNFNCCPSVHVDNHTVITPTKCTLLLLKAPDITVCTLCHYILPLHVSTRVDHLQGAQYQCLAKVIINYNLLKLC
jgi:hypothetical protein